MQGRTLAPGQGDFGSLLSAAHTIDRERCIIVRGTPAAELTQTIANLGIACDVDRPGQNFALIRCDAVSTRKCPFSLYRCVLEKISLRACQIRKPSGCQGRGRQD